jgi:ribosomal protein S20
MAITSSAKKAYRASLKKKEFNDVRKANIRKAIKTIQKYVREKNAEKATEGLKQAFKALDKAAKQHTIKKGTADRKKSRLAKLVKTVS